MAREENGCRWMRERSRWRRKKDDGGVRAMNEGMRRGDVMTDSVF